MGRQNDVGHAQVGDLAAPAGALPEVHEGVQGTPGQERPELLERFYLLRAPRETPHLAIQCLAGYVLLAPQILIPNVSAKVLHHRIAFSRIAAEDQPVDLLFHLFGRERLVDVGCQLVGVPRARLNRDAVDGLTVA